MTAAADMVRREARYRRMEAAEARHKKRFMNMAGGEWKGLEGWIQGDGRDIKADAIHTTVDFERF